jgi:glycosyltransferase involved in cell wall biosynthesis
LVDGLFGLTPDKGVVIGAPVRDISVNANGFRKKYGIEGDFLLYVGRLDIMKGVGKLLEYFERYSRARGNGLKLVLCGKGPMRVPERANVIPLGYVPDDDKFGAIKHAIAMVQPSYYESFSFSLMESMLCGTPVIANAECEVLHGHCVKSGGGISYRSYEEFERAIDMLLHDGNMRKRMGEAGKNYVLNNYTPTTIGEKYIITIDKIINDWKTSTSS